MKKQSLLTITTLFLSLISVANALTITVTANHGLVAIDGECSIAEAIIAANTDTASNECPAGNGTDTIDLTTSITLTQAFENNGTYGRTGTPAITTNITLDGKGFTLQRDSSLGCTLNLVGSANEFRVLRHNGGNLVLQNISISYGCADYSANSIGKLRGGGLYNRGNLSVINTTFSHNQARVNGGALSHHNGTIIEISNSKFYANSTKSEGGAIYNFATITTIQNSTFSANSAVYNGGAIMNNQIITTIQNSTFFTNSADQGGAIHNLIGTITTIQNSTFSANSVGYKGGAIFNNNTISTIKNSTFSGNSSGFTASAIYNISTITTVKNSLFHNNDNGECINDRTLNTTNNISTDASSLCHNVAVALTASTLGPLADNGGATKTHALLVASEALDAAINGTTTDQRGFSVDGVRDLGAYEAQVPVVTAPADITMEATGANTAVSIGTASVVDADEIGVTVLADISSPFIVGTHTVTWTATDAQGHIGTATQTVTITDTTGPTVTSPSDITIEATGAMTPVILGSATATDLVYGVITPVTANMSSPFAVGIHNITWSATDNAGNIGTATQVVNVQAVISGTMAGLNGSVTLQNNGSDNISLNADGGFRFATALDNLSPYTITILNQPASQFCTVNNASGQVNGNNISNIAVTCIDNTVNLDTSSLDFGLVYLSENDTQTVTLTNTGSGNMLIDSFSNPTSPFSIIGGSCLTVPVTLMVAQSCDFIIEFKPTIVGSFTDSFMVNSNAISSPNSISLIGSSAIRIIPIFNRFGLILLLLLFVATTTLYIKYTQRHLIKKVL